MRRFWASLRWEIVLQLRHGFYAVSAITALVWVALGWPLLQATKWPLLRVIPLFLFVNVLITTFYFVAGIVLLEKSEGSLWALITTPLRKHEYLSAKCATLGGLAIIESLLVALICAGSLGRWIFLLLGLMVLCVTLVCLGFASVVAYDAINDYLMPSVGWVTLMILPIILSGAGVEHPLVWLHPLTPALIVLRQAYTPHLGLETLLSLLLSSVWAVVAWRWAMHAFVRFVDPTSATQGAHR